MFVRLPILFHLVCWIMFILHLPVMFGSLDSSTQWYSAIFEPPKHTIIIGLHGDFPCLYRLVKVNMFPFIWIYLGDVPFYSEESQRGFPPFLLGVIPTPITRCVQVLTKLEASSAESWINGMGQVSCGRKNCLVATCQILMGYPLVN